MSASSPRRLPDRPSLEQLRKQAKEHLDTLRAADPSAKLADAQHELAREYGFDSWPKLVHHVEAMNPANRLLQPADLKSFGVSATIMRSCKSRQTVIGFAERALRSPSFC